MKLHNIILATTIAITSVAAQGAAFITSSGPYPAQNGGANGNSLCSGWTAQQDYAGTVGITADVRAQFDCSVPEPTTAITFRGGPGMLVLRHSRRA